MLQKSKSIQVQKDLNSTYISHIAHSYVMRLATSNTQISTKVSQDCNTKDTFALVSEILGIQENTMTFFKIHQLSNDSAIVC